MKTFCWNESLYIEITVAWLNLSADEDKLTCCEWALTSGTVVVGFSAVAGTASVQRSNSKLVLDVCALQKTPAYIVHRTCITWSFCVLGIAATWFQPPWEPALPPTPSQCPWCVSQGCGYIQKWTEESLSHLFDQLERAEMLAACFLGSINRTLCWIGSANAALKAGSCCAYFLSQVRRGVEKHRTAAWGTDDRVGACWLPLEDLCPSCQHLFSTPCIPVSWVPDSSSLEDMVKAGCRRKLLWFFRQ